MKKETKLTELRTSASDIVSACREAVGAYQRPDDPEHLLRMLDACVAEIDAIDARVDADLRRLGPRRLSAGKQFRLLQASYGTLRTPRTPDNTKTMQLVGLFWALEAGLSAGVMIAGGAVDVPTGLAYGAVLALITTILGLATGFLALRYLNYRDPQNIFDMED